MTSRFGLALAAIVAVLLLAATSLKAAQPARAGEPEAAADQRDPEPAAAPSAPVMLGGEPVVWIPAAAGPYSAAFRAERITQRLEAAVHDRSLRDVTITVVEADGASELHLGSRVLMAVTARDAAAVGAARPSVAQQYAQELERALRAERLRYAPATLVRSGLYSLFATLAFAGIAWLIWRVSRRLTAAVRRWFAGRSESLRSIDEEIFAGNRSRRVIATMRAVRLVLLFAAFDVYLTYVLGLFPWTRAVSSRLLQYAVAPVRAVAAAFVGYLPNLLFVLVIVSVVYVAIRLVGVFFRLVQQGRLVFANFPAEWADPTNKIARALLAAFGVVVAFPYLPASKSPAFAGVSVFMGVLVSLASSSALSNAIAGLVLTYTGAFRIGDRVKLGDAFGDIVETSLLVTRVRTIKNEDITIPNGIVLGSAATNYSRAANTLGLILHTSVTIGYDAPWRRVHDLLIDAALATPGVLDAPPPFVWQTALNDFYVTYEINAYTSSPKDMIDIYAALHARIQDTFYAAGVEIMSPHYTSVRDGNTVAIPPAFRAPDYQPAAFRVEDATAARMGSRMPR